MPLSRLENFLKNAEGNILYVSPSDFDSTDGFENQGNSLTRPFKTIQRALIEAARFSYQQGKNNDKIDRTTILVYPGTHYIDNRPGFSIENQSGSPLYKQQISPDTWVNTFLNEFGRGTNYDILDQNNDLYKFNSVYGGVILPRGTSIIGLDLRKTKVRPLYVPDPEDDSIKNSSIFNVTGTCYFTAFTFFDSDLNKFSYKDYTTNQYVPNYSHHKLVAFAYGDGVNKVALGNQQTNLTDLDMYYYKVAKAYGDLTARGIVDYPTNDDFETSIDEYRIVGSLEANPLGIGSITSGDGIATPANIIRITTSDFNTGEQKPHGLFVDSPFYIDGVEQDPNIYNGSFTVREVVGLTTFTYVASGAPTVGLSADDFSSATILLESDTVTSASPYVFNCSLRSVYGLCGMWADGNKADGFKSMVVAQFTGVSLQKDDNAFMIYQDGNYEDNFSLSVNSPERPLHSNAKSKFKPKYENFHVRASNNSFIQCVSIFAIGFSRHFLTESGADMSITNSNSNFGSVSLESSGFKNESFDRDDVGYITHIIPPRELDKIESAVSWITLDTSKIISVGNTSRLYLFGYSSKDFIPSSEIDGFRVGAKSGEILNLTLTSNIQQVNYTSPILMTVPFGTGVSSKKTYKVLRSGIYNSIDANGVFEISTPHQLHNGESVRVFSSDAIPPDNLVCDKIYYAITNEVNLSLTATQIQLAFSLNDAISGNKINNINNNGGELTITSNVSDKIPGELGHPIQWDSSQNNWYVVGSSSTSTNTIYQGILNSPIDQESPTTFIYRKLDNRSIEERVYKIRYVVPKEFETARPPQSGFVIQESKSVDPSSISFNSSSSINQNTPPVQLRNDKIITNASVGAVVSGTQIVTITTEKRHNFLVGDKVKIKKIISENNITGIGITSTYNGSFYIKTIPNSKEFTYELTGVKINPGIFLNKINERDTRRERESLPLVSREEYRDNYYIYRIKTIRDHIPGITGQDGIYHIIALSSSISPNETINYNISDKKFNPDVRHLYPQIDRDNYDFDPLASISSGDAIIIGKILTNDRRNSITKESIDYFVKNNKIGFGITGITASGVGNTTVTIFTDIEHGLNGIKNIQINVPGAGYGNTTIYSSSLVGAAGTGASARITLTAGSVTGIEIVDPGTFYSSGNQLSVSPPLGVTPSSTSLISVTEINNNVNDGLHLGGFREREFNGVYRILSIPSSKTITILVPTNTSTPVIDSTIKRLPYASLASKGIGIVSFAFSDVSSGIVTVTTNNSHGLLPGNKFTVVGSGTTIYDGSFVVENNISLTSFDFYVGQVNSSPSSTTGFLLKNSFSSNGISLVGGEENIGGRTSYFYAGITTTTTTQLNQSNTTITLSNTGGFSRGDYAIIDNEIIRIASLPVGNTFNVLRGQLGTLKGVSASGSQIKKIKVIPVELRRPSFMRASGHTFEYLGYGPGNYSTGMPQKQTTILSSDDIAASQSRKMSGGIVVYTGMNDLGEFYSGSKKLSSNTGEESVVDAPIITFTGDDAREDQSRKLSGIYDDLLVRERLTIEGGENNNQSSQFYGPVNFTQKVTNSSDSGIITKNLLIKGKLPQAKLLTVGIGTTSSAIKTEVTSSKIGDFVFQNTPTTYIGASYDGSEWKRFGLLSQTKDILDMRMDRLGIGDTSVFLSYGGVGDKELYVSGDAIFQRVTFIGETVFDSGVTLNDVNFRDLLIKGTAKFDIDPGVAVTSYTQVHKDGTSLLNDLEVAGISTYRGVVDFQSNITGIGATFGNIRIGFVNDNEIDTSNGNLILDSVTGNTVIDDNVLITNGNFTVTTGTAVTTGLSTTRVLNSTRLQVGLSTVGFGGTSIIEVFDRHNVGLEIKRSANVGTGSSISEISHYGLSDFRIVSVNASDLKLFTNQTERVRVGLSGTITSFQNNSGEDLRGANLRITQAGSGDVALSWDTTFNNVNRRWYAGIDASDSYSWKLASPGVTVGFGSERFDTLNETKITVETTGNVSIAGTINVNGRTFDSDASLRSNKQIFNLLNDTVLTLNVGQAANDIVMLPTSDGPKVNIRSITDSTNASSGALVVNGGVGINRNLYVGQLFRVLSNVQSTSSTSGSLVVTGGSGIGGNLNVGGNASIGGNLGISGSFTLTGNTVIGASIVIGGNSIISGISTVIGATNLQNILNVTGATTLSNTLSVTGTVVLSNTLSVAGATNIGDSLIVSGNGTFNENLTVIGSNTVGINSFRVQNNSGNDRFVVDSANGNTTISGTLGVTGATALSSTLGVTGATVLSSTLGVTGNIAVNTNKFTIIASSGDTNIAGNLNISGICTVVGNQNIGGNLTVSGSGLFDQTLTVKGSNTANSNFFRVQTDNSVDRFVVDSANGNTTISGTLGVTGATTLTGLLDANGGATIDNVRIGVAADNEIDTSSGNLIIDSAGGTVEIDDNLTVSGTSIFNGNVTLGNATTDTVTFTSRVNSSVLPSTNALTNVDLNGKDLGGTSNYWRSVYAREFIGALTGNADSATIAANLNRTVTAGDGLTGGGLLNNQNITLNVVGGSGIAVSVDAVAVDATVVRTSGNQTVGGEKTFTNATTLSSTLGVAGATTISSTLGVTGDISLGGELNFSSANNKYIDFFTDNGAGGLFTAHLRLVNNAQSSFHSAIEMTRGGAVSLFHNSALKLSTTATGASVTGTLSAGTLSGNLNNTLTLNTSGTGLSGSTTFNNSGAATFTVASNATSANTGGAIVARDGNGDFSARIISAATFSGNLNNTLTLGTAGTGLSGSTTFNNSGAATFTVASNATSANTGGAIVARDGNGDFSARIISATTFSGGGTIPVGGIIMWSGSVASIPDRWALCNGANGTPNLQDRFIVGAGSGYSPGNIGGENSVTLNTNQIPSHSHNASSFGAGGHSHNASSDPQGSHFHGLKDGEGGEDTNSILGSPSGTPNLSGQGRGTVFRYTDQLMDYAGSHSHTISIDGVGDHSHTISIGDSGGGQSHENRPPYYALAFIMRTS